MTFRIYLRVSTDEQDVQTQLDHIFIYLKNIGHQNADYEVYRDKITSRKELSERPGGQQLLKDLKTGDTVVALRLDRLSRSLLETVLLQEVLDKANAEILLVQQPGIKNKIMLGIYAGMAEEEVKLLRKRISEKLMSKRMRKERYSGRLPYGFAMHETKLVSVKQGKDIVRKRGVLIPVYEEQEAIKIMKELYADGRTYGDIVKVLDELNIKNREGKRFHKATIRRILLRKEIVLESVAQ
jgi:DNA invertase Pin-like site-specific DNA recombinase